MKRVSIILACFVAVWPSVCVGQQAVVKRSAKEAKAIYEAVRDISKAENLQSSFSLRSFVEDLQDGRVPVIKATDKSEVDELIERSQEPVKRLADLTRSWNKSDASKVKLSEEEELSLIPGSLTYQSHWMWIIALRAHRHIEQGEFLAASKSISLAWFTNDYISRWFPDVHVFKACADREEILLSLLREYLKAAPKPAQLPAMPKGLFSTENELIVNLTRGTLVNLSALGAPDAKKTLIHLNTIMEGLPHGDKVFVEEYDLRMSRRSEDDLVWLRLRGVLAARRRLNFARAGVRLLNASWDAKTAEDAQAKLKSQAFMLSKRRTPRLNSLAASLVVSGDRGSVLNVAVGEGSFDEPRRLSFRVSRVFRRK